jgi:hypothetical protein
LATEIQGRPIKKTKLGESLARPRVLFIPGPSCFGPEELGEVFKLIEPRAKKMKEREAFHCNS